MSSHSINEIIGDWNNLKGTHYHLIFALSLILTRQSSVEFYKGNDLFAYSLTTISLESMVTVPPLPDESLTSDSASPVSLYSPSSGEDWWIQLKSTKSKWTMTQLLKENLLINFIYNAFESGKRGHKWRAWLVTQGEIDSDKILKFIATPTDYPELNKRFNEIIDEAYTQIIKNDPSLKDFRHEIYRIACLILEQISETEPVPLAVMQLQIEKELALAFPDRESINQICKSLLGAMIEDSAAGPDAAKVYNSDWVNLTVQRPVIRQDLLDKSVSSACDAAVQRAASLIGYDSDLVVPREAFANSFSRYLASDKTCYVLLGTNGVGKSWMSTYAAISMLKNQSRLLIRGIAFNGEKKLEDLVADELRKYSSANWSNSQFLQKLMAAPRKEDQPSFVIILDDLSPVGNVEKYCNNLEQLVRDCKEAGAKLVVTCQLHIWNFLRLGKYLAQTDVFRLKSNESVSLRNANSPLEESPDSNTTIFQNLGKHSQQKYSFVLSDFSPEEMEKAVHQRLPEAAAVVVYNQLRMPSFQALRKPFFFDRYFEKNISHLRKPKEVPSAYIDELLDWIIDSAVERSSADLELSKDDLEPTLIKLIEALWTQRPQGLKYREAIEALKPEIADKAGDVINSWRRSGFLTFEGNINFAQPLVADRIFAKLVARKTDETNFEFLTELDLEKDFGTVIAYLRQSSAPTVPAEKLIKLNNEWTSTIVAGLAQTEGKDWRVLAMLSSLLYEYQYSDLSGDIYNALGQLAARSNRAYKWVAEMYLGDHAQTWRRGAYAFTSTVEYEPRRVEKAVRTRLMRLVEINRDFFNKDKRKGWILANALSPFRNINHPTAARVGRRVVNRYKFILGSDSEENQRRDWDFIREADEIRGRVAIFDEDEFTRLLTDLENENPVIRFRAAQRIIKLAIEKAEIIQEAICRRIELEDKASTLQRLLIAAYHLIAKFPDELLISLNRSSISNFTEGFRTTDSLMFELLGNLAPKKANEIIDILPLALPNRDSVEQVLVGEMFIYAWWRVYEFSNHSADYSPFELFDQIDTSEMELDFRPFVIRCQVVALLARMCLELNIPTSDLTGRQRFYPGLNKDFLFIDFGDFLDKHLAILSAHESFEQFKQLLLECVRQSDPVNLYPLSRLRNAVFNCGGSCLELLTDIAIAMPDPIPLLDALPHGWQAIRVTAELLKMGKSDDSVVNFAKLVLSEQEGSSTAQADAESRELRAQLGLLESDHEKSLREQRKAANRLSIFSDASNAHGIATFASQNPDKFLEYLAVSIHKPDDVITLYSLVEKARNWQTLLITRVYARMVNQRTLTLKEAQSLCEQMLISIRTMSPSLIKEQYETVYQNISSLLNGKTIHSLKVLNTDKDNSENIIDKSHRLASKVINLIIETPVSDRTEEWLENLLYSCKWWEETDRFFFADSLLITGHGQYGIYFFPAIRLALFAAGLQAKINDPAARIMRERNNTHKLLANYRNLADRDNLSHYEEEISYAFRDLDKAFQETPRDERVEDLRGLILLKLNRLDEAEDALEKSLAIPTSTGSFRAGTFYNLACVYAGQNNFEKCRQALLESATLRPLDKKWMTKDADLDPVRSEQWFQELISEGSEE